MSQGEIRKIKFETTLSSFGETLWVFVPVTTEIAARLEFPDKKFRRVVCTINGGEGFHCALMPSGSGEYIISVNKKKRDELGIRIGDIITVELERDESKYGLPMPEEFREVLAQDPEGDRLFHALTPGKQRSLLYQANQKKDLDLRIHRALAIIEHLKENDGQVVWEKLGHDLKRPPAEETYRKDRKKV
jgi:bifunctional DNA-binding transcriptional regulator/antitoxin component of YhaV-PrlF toxin-antitoxin module